MIEDECLDVRLRHSFPEHDCQTVRYAGFSGLRNGQLLEAAEANKFEVLLTVDQGLEHEHNLTGRKIAIIVFQATTIRLRDLLPHVPACAAQLATIKAGEIRKIPAD